MSDDRTTDVNLDEVVDLADAKQAILDSTIQGIQLAEHDGEVVREHPLPDRLKALDRLAKETASTHAHGGMRFSVFTPHGGGG